MRLLAGGAGFLLVLSVAAVAIVAAASGPSARAGSGVLLGLSSLGSMLGGLVFGARAGPLLCPAGSPGWRSAWR